MVLRSKGSKLAVVCANRTSDFLEKRVKERKEMNGQRARGLAPLAVLHVADASVGFRPIPSQSNRCREA